MRQTKDIKSRRKKHHEHFGVPLDIKPLIRLAADGCPPLCTENDEAAVEQICGRLILRYSRLEAAILSTTRRLGTRAWNRHVHQGGEIVTGAIKPSFETQSRETEVILRYARRLLCAFVKVEAVDRFGETASNNLTIFDRARVPIIVAKTIRDSIAHGSISEAWPYVDVRSTSHDRCYHIDELTMAAAAIDVLRQNLMKLGHFPHEGAAVEEPQDPKKPRRSYGQPF